MTLKTSVRLDNGIEVGAILNKVNAIPADMLPWTGAMIYRTGMIARRSENAKVSVVQNNLRAA